MQQKMRVKLDAEMWSEHELAQYKFTTTDYYEITETNGYGSFKLKGKEDQGFWNGTCFTTPEPVPTPCPSDWQPAQGHTVDHYEAECINNENNGRDLVIGRNYKLGYRNLNDDMFNIEAPELGDNNGWCKFRFSTPTLRAEYRDKPETEQPIHFETVILSRDWTGVELNTNTTFTLLKGHKLSLFKKDGVINIVNSLPTSKYEFHIPCYFFEPEVKQAEQPEYAPNILKVRCIGNISTLRGTEFTSGVIYSVKNIDKFGRYIINCDFGDDVQAVNSFFELVTDEQLIENIKNIDSQPDMVNHPTHYGGKDNPYEVIKVLDAWGLKSNAYLWNAGKYIGRAGKKDDLMRELLKSQFYLNMAIDDLENDGTPKEMTVELLMEMAMELLQQAKNMMQDEQRNK